MTLIAFTLAPSAQAQDEAEVGRAIVAMEDAAGAKLSVTRSARTGLATFITTPAGRFIPVPDGRATTASARGLSFIDQYGGAFGLRGRGSVEVTSVQKDELGIEHVRMQQRVSGVPVTGGELILHMKGNRVLAANGKTAPGLDDFLVIPAVASNEALNAVRDLVAKHLKSPNAVLSEPRLEVLDQGLLNGRAFPRRLAWFVEARGENLREFVWIDASNRMTLLRFSQLSHARNRFIHNGNSASALPGTLMRTEGGAATGDVDADRAYDFSGHTYDYFLSNHGRDSYDGAGAPLVSTVHHCPPTGEGPCPYPNAFWNGQQMVYGNGFSSADDVVAHELTHAVVERSANLFYYMQSGALNESFADIFGETVDLLNGAGNDDGAVRWHMGEDLTGFGAIRNMMTPTAFGDPGKMSDPQFKCETDPLFEDLGGVHGNSGVPNHAYALMVDGGTYNGITVSGIGLAKAAKIQYRSLTRYLVSSSDFLDNYNALQLACADLVGTAGITGANCAEVKDALDAVQMANPWPCSATYGVNAAVPALCSAGNAPLNAFFDGFETGLGNWSVSGTPALTQEDDIPHWARTSSFWGPNAFATGGTDSAWAYNQAQTSESRLTLGSNLTIPTGARLQFNHSFGFENFLSDTYDGGIFEYSTDGGATWASMASLHAAGAAYNGTILSGTGNPLAGQTGFVKDSFGFTASQYNLLPLEGQAQVRFRFRVGTDPSVDDYGWFIDDFRIYTCVDIATMVTPAPASTLTGPSQTFTWNGVAGATEYWLQVGYTPGGTDIYGASQGTSLSGLVTGLPVDGRAVHVRLWSKTGGQWLYNDYTYTAADLPLMSCPAVVNPGGSIAVQVFGGATATDWLGVYPDGAGNGAYTTWAHVPLPRPQTVNLPAPLAPGSYDIRLFPNNSGTVILAACDIAVAIVPTLSVSDVSVAEGNAGTSNATFTVSLAPAAAGTVTVAYATANGTATSGSDYVAATGTLTFAAGEMSKTVVVQVNGDTAFESNESFSLNLTSPTGGALIGDGQGAGTITNDDPLMTCPATVNPGGSIAVQVLGGETATDWLGVYPDGAGNGAYTTWSHVPLPRPQTVNLVAPSAPGSYDIRLFPNNSGTVILAACDILVVTTPTLSVNDVTVFEGNAGTSNATFTVSLSPAAAGTVTVAYATANGTATSGSDYSATMGTLTFAAGETTKTVAVVVNGDTTPEANETFVLNLTSPTGGAVIGDSQGVGTIATEDAGMTCPASATPGGVIAVQLLGGAMATDWVALYPDGAANSAYASWSHVPLPRPQTLNLTAPVAPGSYDIRFWENNGSSVLLGSCDIVVASAPTLSVSDVSVAEGNAGTSSATFTVSLLPAAGGAVTVAYATADGTATSGTDYLAATGMLTFAAGETSKTVMVQVNGDTAFESNESFSLNLTSPTGGALIGDGQGAGTITNDDP
ncbi:MAG: M4 family metallopeptidase, partial [Vicinamibacteria bacterium]|nr:M4 family metallopeptidase [Vicinamibacteria bacterium]